MKVNQLDWSTTRTPEPVSEGFYRVPIEWRGVIKYAFGTTPRLATRNAIKLVAFFNITDRAYERERAKLELTMGGEQNGFYYYEDALLRRSMKVPLSDDNRKALEWYNAIQSEDRPDPWAADF